MDGCGASHSEDSDDPVIKEIPIVHCKRLNDNLHLFQYPLKKRACTNEHNIKRCFFKPQNQEVKLELAIDVDSPNFDTVRAEVIAQEVDGDKDFSKKNKQYYFDNDLVDRVVLTSTRTIKDSDRYATAAFNGSEVHLTSLKGVFQFRPFFSYLEKSLKKKKDADEDSGEEEAGPSSAQQVTVRFKQNDERWKKAAQNSYKFLQAKSAEEPWTQLEWCESDTPKSSVERLKLIADELDDISQEKLIANNEYVKLLVPEDQEQAPLVPSLPSHVLSLHALRALPIVEQCRLLLKDAQIIQFQQLFMLLAGGEGLTTDILLKTLPKVAVLVRGNWIVKSDVLYPQNTFSAVSGVPAELMCRARDYVLYLFTKNQYVERKKVSSVMKIPSEEVKDIFTGISKLRNHNKGWELHLPPDVDFVNKHSDIAQKQNLFWEHRFHQLTEFLKDNKGQRRKSRSESKSMSEDSRTRNGLSESDSGTEKNASPVAVRKQKAVVKVNGLLGTGDTKA